MSFNGSRSMCAHTHTHRYILKFKSFNNGKIGEGEDLNLTLTSAKWDQIPKFLMRIGGRSTYMDLLFLSNLVFDLFRSKER